MSLIFVGGIHGAGKTVFCKALAASLRAAHYSAGQLIRDRLALRQSDRDKRVMDLDENQYALLAAVDELRISAPAIILDGHFALLTATEGVAAIPEKVFEVLRPDALIVIDTEPKKAAQRLRRRDQSTYPVAVLDALRETELKHAHSISMALGIPLTVLKDPRVEAVESLVKPLLAPNGGSGS